MRWPWQPGPGMVRVPARQLIELQAQALRAVELEAQIAEHHRRSQAARAKIRALRLIDRTGPERLPGEVVDAVCASLPLTVTGDLHEEAFTALVDARTWAQREEQLRALTVGAEEKRA